MEEIKIPCPAKTCKFYLIAEINTEIVPEADRPELIESAKKQLTKSVRKHHKDGHPKS